MKCSITKLSLGVVATLLVSSLNTNAQDIHFTQFNAAPLTINPAFTGGFNGQVRASAVYRDQWRSALGSAAFKTYAASVDMPVIRDISIDDYLAAGLQFYNDRAGDGNLNQTTVLGSVAYHKFLGTDGNKELAVGFQGGYSKQSLDLSRLYFQGDFNDGTWVPGTSPVWNNLTNGVSSWVINAGISWSHRINDKFSYVLGAGANNLNQPLQSFDRREVTGSVGLGIRYTGQLGAIIGVSDRFTLRPAVLYQYQKSAQDLVAGNEFHYRLGDDFDLPMAPAVFVGGWWRKDDAAMITGGVEWKGFRVGVAYDYNTSNLKYATNNNGGFEIMVRYILANPIDRAKNLLYPCARF